MTAIDAPPTPAWLTRPEVALCPCGCIGKRSKRDFIERTIAGSTDLMRRSMYSDDVSAHDGLLQRVDPRA